MLKWNLIVFFVKQLDQLSIFGKCIRQQYAAMNMGESATTIVNEVDLLSCSDLADSHDHHLDSTTSSKHCILINKVKLFDIVELYSLIMSGLIQ